MAGYGSYTGSGGSSFDFAANHIFTGQNQFSGNTILATTSISGGTFLVSSSANTFSGGTTAFIENTLSFNTLTATFTNTVNNYNGGQVNLINSPLTLLTTSSGIVSNLYLGKTGANKIEIGNNNTGSSSTSYGYINSFYGVSTPTYLVLNTNNTGLSIGSPNTPETGVMIQKPTRSSLGIYSADSAAKLFFESYNGGVSYMGTYTATPIYFQTTNTNRLVLHANGRLGVKKLIDDKLGQIQLDGKISYYNATTTDGGTNADAHLIVYCEGIEYLIQLRTRV